jgi:hypothetical protein
MAENRCSKTLYARCNKLKMQQINALNLDGVRIAGGEGTRKREAADNTRYGEKATKSAADLKAEFEQCLDRIRRQPASRTKSSGTHKQEAHDDSAPTASETAEPSPQAESTAAAPSSSSAAGQQQQQVIWDQILKNLPEEAKEARKLDRNAEETSSSESSSTSTRKTPPSPDANKDDRRHTSEPRQPEHRERDKETSSSSRRARKNFKSGSTLKKEKQRQLPQTIQVQMQPTLDQELEL